MLSRKKKSDATWTDLYLMPQSTLFISVHFYFIHFYFILSRFCHLRQISEIAKDFFYHWAKSTALDCLVWQAHWRRINCLVVSDVFRHSPAVWLWLWWPSNEVPTGAQQCSNENAVCDLFAQYSYFLFFSKHCQYWHKLVWVTALQFYFCWTGDQRMPNQPCQSFANMYIIESEITANCLAVLWPLPKGSYCKIWQSNWKELGKKNHWVRERLK